MEDAIRGEDRTVRVVLAVGTTRTAAIDGISAAGADPDVMVHTPSADAEIVCYGEPIRAPVVPVSPTGTPTPALVTRAVRDLVDFDVTVVDAGLAEPTGAPTVTVGARPGGDVRDEDPVATAHGAFEAARQFGRALPDDAIYLGESIPGGTTTALGVQAALGEGAGVSSSLPENPVEQKREVVAEGLAASGLDEGDAARDPKVAIRRMGDPVLAVAAGTALGCLETDTAVTLAGGTQLTTVAALLRHAGVEQPLELATTAFVAEDPSVDIDGLADALDLSVTVTDPGFEAGDHPAFDGYVAGEAKEGVAMGGALALARATGVPMADVRERVLARYRALPDL
ncbi:nicotinate mononucleotide-dependent phosphoribosyltransferase CobT [Halosimplex halobium]|uniref:nicotinate mononucleotide-dependent phosphoribosyltransferase CobT n=1 Tax=Halosimplex halobium TaxID=3396618 RepID=UPI003F550162